MLRLRHIGFSGDEGLLVATRLSEALLTSHFTQTALRTDDTCQRRPSILWTAWAVAATPFRAKGHCRLGNARTALYRHLVSRQEAAQRPLNKMDFVRDRSL